MHPDGVLKGVRGKNSKDIYEKANTTKECQVKGEKHVEDLTSSADYITKKFDK